MKTSLLLLALAALLGLSMAMSLAEKRGAKNLYKVMQERSMGKGGGKKEDGPPTKGGNRKGGDSSSDDDDDDKKKEYLQFQAMLAFASLTTKCEVLVHYIMAEINDTDISFEEAWNATAPYAPTLVAACPHVKEFFDFYQTATEEQRDMMSDAMTPFGLLLQCTNLFADLDTVRYLGFTNTTEDGSPESKLMAHGEPLLGGCIMVFGAASQEEESVEKDLDSVQQKAEAEVDSKELRSLLNQLEELLKSK